jgi:hemerythrin-like domain-containing protein
LSTWESLHKQHLEVFTKINLLEKALLDLLQNHAARYMEGTANPQKDFLKAFEDGMILHFTVEENALFPVLGKVGKKGETLATELVAEHGSIMQKYSRIVQTRAADNSKNEILLELIHELGGHGRKEEETISPLISQLTSEQLSSIDQSAKLLGYHL